MDDSSTGLFGTSTSSVLYPSRSVPRSASRFRPSRPVLADVDSEGWPSRSPRRRHKSAVSRPTRPLVSGGWVPSPDAVAEVNYLTHGGRALEIRRLQDLASGVGSLGMRPREKRSRPLPRSSRQQQPSSALVPFGAPSGARCLPARPGLLRPDHSFPSFLPLSENGLDVRSLPPPAEPAAAAPRGRVLAVQRGVLASLAATVCAASSARPPCSLPVQLSELGFLAI